MLTETSGHPGGWHLRPPTRDDAQAVADLIIANDLLDLGHAECSLDEVLSSWETPGFDLTKDAWVLEDAGGALAGYAALWPDRDGSYRLDPCSAFSADQPTPDGWALLVARAEERARERAPRDGIEAPIAIRTVVVSPRRQQPIEALGYQAVHVDQRMTIDFGEPPATPTPPADITLRPLVPEHDAPAAHQVIQEAFLQIPGRDRPWEPFDSWRDWAFGRTNFSAAASHVALAGADLVGATICGIYPDGAWLYQLAVDARWRGRGIGEALLLATLRASYEVGARTLSLTVDEPNLAARRLYERVGMRPTVRQTTYEKLLRGQQPVK